MYRSSIYNDSITYYLMYKTLKAYRLDNKTLRTDFGATLEIIPDIFTQNIPIAEWRYWIIDNHKVIKAIPL